jgi:branched-chain amino acid transport system ATP-binding protein
MNDSTLLLAKQLTIRFGGVMAVDRVDIHLGRGEIIGLIGPNGSGKTTLFNIITGIYQPTEGKIFYQGEIITGRSPAEIGRRGIARTFQNSRLFLELSVVENVLSGMCYRRNTGLRDALLRPNKVKTQFNESVTRAVQLLSFFSKELGETPYKKAGDLPLPDRRRVEICRALASEPDLLLLDEPSAGMDPSETSALMDEIRRVKNYQREIGMIIIEHDMTVIEGVADRVIVLNYGQKIAEGLFRTVASLPQVRQAYLGEKGRHAQG